MWHIVAGQRKIHIRPLTYQILRSRQKSTRRTRARVLCYTVQSRIAVVALSVHVRPILNTRDYRLSPEII